MFAPRIGFIYDPTKEGKSKVFGHYGQFYENVPMDLNVRVVRRRAHELHVGQLQPPHADGAVATTRTATSTTRRA